MTRWPLTTETTWDGDTDTNWGLLDEFEWTVATALTIYQQTTNLTNGQILDLHNTPVEITPAPTEVGNVIVPLFVMVTHNYGGTNFAGTGGSNVFAITTVSNYADSSTRWGGLDDGMFLSGDPDVDPFFSFAMGSSIAGILTGSAGFNLSTPADEPLVILYEGNGLTTGNGTGTVRVIYTELASA